MQGVIKEAESLVKRRSFVKLDDDKRAVKKKVAFGIGFVMLLATFVMMNVTLLQAFQEDPLSHHENGWMGPLLKERIGRIGMRKKAVKAEGSEAQEASKTLMPVAEVDEGPVVDEALVEEEALEGEVEIPAPMLEDHHHTRKPTMPPVDPDPGERAAEAAAAADNSASEDAAVQAVAEAVAEEAEPAAGAGSDAKAAAVDQAEPVASGTSEGAAASEQALQDLPGLPGGNGSASGAG